MKFSLVFLACLVATTSAQTECGSDTYYGPSGVISSPNYPFAYAFGLDCYYNIYTTPGSSIVFIFTAFGLENQYDYVYVNCQGNSSSLSTKSFTGGNLPKPLSAPWCSQGRVRFTSDEAVSYSGFSLDYYVSIGGCGNTLYNGSSGYITSPSFPAYYGHNQNCTNIIHALQPSHFHLNFLFIDLPACGLCTCDWVEISCLDNEMADKQRFCGEVERSFDIYSCTRVLVWFRTDSTNAYPGFRIEYTVDQAPEPTTIPSTTTRVASTVPPTSAPTTPTTTSLPTSTSKIVTTTFATTTLTVPTTASTVSSTLLTTPSTKAPQAACGNTSYYGPSGVISSPNYPGYYPNHLDCDYNITASSSSSSIAIIFTAFETQQCCDYVTISCPTNANQPSLRYSGSSLPTPFSIPSCSKATVNFNTDGSTAASGFSLDYHVSLNGCGDTVYTGSHGYVSSPNYPGTYENNQNCSNIIWSNATSSFSITFQAMNVEECCDFVELSCLDNAEYGSHRFTGSSLPPKLAISGCTQVLVWFFSDDTISQPGFNLEYIVSPDKRE